MADVTPCAVPWGEWIRGNGSRGNDGKQAGGEMEDGMERAMGEGVVQGGGAICCVSVELKHTTVCVCRR